MVVFDNFKDQSGLIQWLNIPVRAIYLSQPRKLCVNSLNDITSLAKSRCQDLLQAQEAFFSFLTLYKTVSTVQPWLPCQQYIYFRGEHFTPRKVDCEHYYISGVPWKSGLSTVLYFRGTLKKWSSVSHSILLIKVRHVGKFQIAVCRQFFFRVRKTSMFWVSD